jgi:hypothetical protein
MLNFATDCYRPNLVYAKSRKVRQAALEIEILSEVTWERGARSLYFRDPDGHLMEPAAARPFGQYACPEFLPRPYPFQLCTAQP